MPVLVVVPVEYTHGLKYWTFRSLYLEIPTASPALSGLPEARKSKKNCWASGADVGHTCASMVHAVGALMPVNAFDRDKLLVLNVYDGRHALRTKSCIPPAFRYALPTLTPSKNASLSDA
jgi:hypothetical protein